MDNIPIIKDYQLTAYFQELSADSLYPSAGSSAAMTAAHAAALFAMVCRVNLRKISEDLSAGEASKEESENRKIFWEETLHQAELFLERSLSLAQEDGFAIKYFVEGDPLGPGKATEIPLEIARCTGEIIALITDALPKSYAPIRADAECARCLAEGSRKAALTVAQHNIPLLSAEERQNYVDQIVELAFPG
ncbi:MAG: cyclodeaminase/cyclohydrolase family protein [Syntrophaceticus schinkii]|jgi:formiminotetrahydrofolate cyclodeaminase|nr:cyclodeaminase/cyclohydrolase family protein [Syntrophaceticus schinkii]